MERWRFSPLLPGVEDDLRGLCGVQNQLCWLLMSTGVSGFRCCAEDRLIIKNPFHTCGTVPAHSAKHIVSFFNTR